MHLWYHTVHLNRVADGTKKVKLLGELNDPTDNNTSQACINYNLWLLLLLQ